MLDTLRIRLAKRRDLRRVARMTREELETFKLGRFRLIVDARPQT